MFDRYTRYDSSKHDAISKQFEDWFSAKYLKIVILQFWVWTRDWIVRVGLRALQKRVRSENVSITITHDSPHDSTNKNLKLEIGCISMTPSML